jgi:S1-C subfamily serine protease
MLTIASCRAAGKFTLFAFWAVLFCSLASAQDNPLRSLESGLNELIYRLSRSVVTVETSYPRPADFRVSGEQDAFYSVIATGVVFDSAGHILTLAASVVNRPLIQVRFEEQSVPAEIRAIDYQTGLALLKTVKPIGDQVVLSSQYGCAGQMVVAVGNAYGLRAAPSMGFCAGIRPDGAVQFTAPIPSSALGGGLFDLSGHLLGVITGGLGRYNRTEIGLAIPSSKLLETAQYLLSRGDRYAGYLGLSTDEMEIFPPLEVGRSSRLISESAGDIKVERGVVITRVVPALPAAKAGLKTGDLLFSVNSQTVSSALHLANFVRQLTPGSIIEFGVIRQNRPYFVPVKVGQAQIHSLQSSFSFTSGEVESIEITDSLLKEIEALKQTIEQLEQRLKQLR